MTGNDLLHALNDVEEQFIEEAAPKEASSGRRGGRRRFLVTFTRAAAALAAVLVLGIGLSAALRQRPSQNAVHEEAAAAAEDTGRGDAAPEAAAAAETGEGYAEDREAAEEKAEEALMGNPFEEFGTLAEAEAAAGIAMEVPQSASGSSSCIYRAMSGEQPLIEVIYLNSAFEEVCRVRKGVSEEDISGDHTAYEEEISVQEGTRAYLMKGSGGRYAAVLWQEGEHSFSVHAERPLTKDELLELAGGVR